MRHSATLFATTALAVVTLAGVTSAQPAPLQNEAGVQSVPRQNAVTAYPIGYSVRWMEDSEFVYGPSLLDFDGRTYLAASAPQLLPHADFITHWCGYFSISPKVLLALIDLRSGLISRPGAGGSVDDPLAGLVPGTGFEEQIKQALTFLYDDFYAYRAANADMAGAQPGGDGMNAATFALLNLFRAGATPAAFAAEVDDARSAFQSHYTSMFPAGKVPGEAQVATPAGLLQLPWKAGTLWYFNGVHTTTGQDPGVMSSIDFTRAWSQVWGDDTSNDYVVAALDGTVTVFSSCSIRVTSPSGWATNYYHLMNIAVANGAQVTKNQTLAVYANTLNQALCQGGSSTGPHVHFSLLNNGQLVSLQDADLAGHLVHPGRYSYDSNQAYMWLERGNVRYYAYQDQITTPPPPGPTCVSFMLYPSIDSCWAGSSMRSSHPGAIAWTFAFQYAR